MDKYAWHDLRKNPRDLPEPEVKVLICTQRKNGTRNIALGWYCKELDRFASGMSNNVIAWKEIEGFEG